MSSVLIQEKFDIKNFQYTEDELIANRYLYDAYDCLKYQKNISPRFCFKYLYDIEDKYGESPDQWVSFNDIVEKFKGTYNNKELYEEYKKYFY